MHRADRREFLERLGLATLGGLTLSERASAVGPQTPENTARLSGDGASTPRGPLGPPADLPRELLGTDRADLGTLYPDVAKLAARNRYAESFLEPPFQDVEAWKRLARQRVLETLLYRPAPVAPDAEVVDRADLGDHIREKVVFRTTPDFRVPGYVLIPKGLTAPAPAIVDLHSHGGMFLFGKEKVIDFGVNHPAMTGYHEKNYDGRPTATELVRRGYVVITIDAFLFGERRVMLDEDLASGYERARYSLDDVTRLNQKCRGKEATLVKSLILAGLTWPGIVFQDDLGTVDYLVTRPEVDPQRIGCLGISMGGYRSLFLAGLDDRIRAASVVGFMSTVAPMIHRHIDTHSWVHFLPNLHRWLDWPDVVAMRAPLPLMVQQCSRDGLFPLAGMEAANDKIAAIYAKAGAAERFVGKFYDEPHQYTRAMQDDAFAWFDQHLKG